MYENLKREDCSPMSAKSDIKSSSIKRTFHFMQEKLLFPVKKDFTLFFNVCECSYLTLLKMMCWKNMILCPEYV